MIHERGELVYDAPSHRTEMLDFLPDDYSRILEIGCYDGTFRQYLNKPCEYWGVEPLKEVADIAKTKMDKVLVDFYDRVANEIPDNYFDLIVVNDVIEHIENPWAFLQSIKKKMTANASIVLSIPNVRYYSNLKELLYLKDWEYKDAGILDITHLRFFTEKSIVRLLNECGFKIEKMEGINPIKTVISNFRFPVVYWLFKLFIGSDIKYLQFGVRAMLK